MLATKPTPQRTSQHQERTDVRQGGLHSACQPLQAQRFCTRYLTYAPMHVCTSCDSMDCSAAADMLHDQIGPTAAYRKLS